MSIFNFFKRKNDPAEKLRRDPKLKFVMWEMELEFLQKQIANMKAVGRVEEANKLLNDFVTRFLKASSGPIATPEDVARVSYCLAYEILPQIVYKRWDEFLSIWNDGISMPLYLALIGAIKTHQRLTIEQIREFQSGLGQLTSEIAVYLIRYPKAPSFPAEFNGPGGVQKLLAIPAEKRPVLAPFFSAALLNKKTGQRDYYNLGHASSGGTQLRFVSSEGSHGGISFGENAEPTPKEFFEMMKQAIDRGA